MRFNGAAFFRTRKQPPGKREQANRKIRFNGAAFFRTRKLQADGFCHLPIWGFNGAAFFRTRKPSYPEGLGFAPRLQRSRVLSNAETLASASTQLYHTCFNGAAFFRTRKLGSDATEPNGCAACFNGAAFFRTRKPAPQHRRTQTGESFNGAAFFRTRKRLGVLS